MPAFPLAARVLTPALALCLLLAAGRGAARHDAPPPAAPDFRHDSFAHQQNAPGRVFDMAQTPDGYLWLVSGKGLTRFDGATFETITPDRGSRFAGKPPMRLMVGRQGEVWIGYGDHGGVAVYRHGRFVDAHMPDPPPQVTGMVAGADGAIWVQWGGISGRLWRLKAGHWALMDQAAGLPAGYLFPMLRAHDGTLWLPVMTPAQDRAGLASLAPGGGRFVWHGGDYDYPALGQDAQGRLWVADRRATRMVADGGGRKVSYRAPAGLQLPALAFDGHGGLWETTRTRGLIYLPGAGLAGGGGAVAMQVFRAGGGLESDRVNAVLADRQGAIWVGGEDGLERLKPSPIVPARGIATSPLDGIRFARTGDGVVHIANSGRLYDIAPGRPARLRLRMDTGTMPCASLDDRLWMANGAGMVRLAGGRRAEHLTLPVQMAFGCLEDRAHTMWVVGEDRTVWHRQQGQWARLGRGDDQLNYGATLQIDRQGAVAFADQGNSVTLMAGGARGHWSLGPLGLGHLRGIDALDSGFLLAMDQGLARLRDGRLAVLSARDYPWLAGILTTMPGPDGKTWFYGTNGLGMAASRDLAAAFDRPGAPIPHRLFDSDDGLPRSAQHLGFQGAQGVVGPDGRLWLASGVGVVVLDGRSLPPAPAAPLVHLSGITYGGLSLRDPGDLVLPAGTTAFRLAFATPGAARPERVQLRFRLDGVDSRWSEPGSQRGTTYTNLGPGAYTFHVMASEDGAGWGRETLLHVTIPPTFPQSWPFKLLCAALAAGALWLAYHLRMRAVAAAMRLRMDERHAERERIARELHDTLLQSIHGLILHVDVAMHALPPQEPARQMLDHALDAAQNAMQEVREKVQALRLPDGAGGLEAELERIAATLLDGHVAWRVESHGRPRRLTPAAAQELGEITREAVFNSLRHAGAGQVSVTLTWRGEAVVLGIADDGVGAPAPVLAAGHREGHYGWVGMRERVAGLKGQIDMANGARGGLVVTVTLPARTAYAARATPWAVLRRWLAGRRRGVEQIA
jgi:signal transduction histidine kinase/ligand-binding sensor domain-containing protein